ncbi:MAG: Ig-like domain-containing protein [Vicinamibacterales bacterium]
MCVLRAVVCLGLIGFVASHAQAQALPPPWTSTDIGAPDAAGSASESGGTFSVRGAGTDIWYSSDQFHFAYQPITGDADIRAQVVGVEYIHEWTKAGVMIRASLDPRSVHASTFVTPARGLVFQRRVVAGGASTSTSGGSQTAPFWVRVVRSGELLTSYISPDGSAWMLVGSETISMPATVYAGLAVVSKDPGRTALATFTDVTVGTAGSSEPPPPPPPPPPTPGAATWADGDIGSPVLAGRASQSGGTFSVTGAGSDIWNDADQFHFMYQAVNGDVDVVARVVDVEYAHAWSKGGVMIREGLTASAAHAFMAGTPGKGWAFQRRPVTGGLSVHSPGSYTTPPGWVRLVRSGSTFSGYESTDGTNWTLIGTETIDMPAGVYVGLAVTSHNTSMTSTATFTDVAITTQTSTNQSPTVMLTAPASGTTYTAPATVLLSATASDPDGAIAKVEFFVNGQSIGSDTESPYDATWNNTAEGSYNLTAVATDDGGAETTSATATVTVNATPNQPPTVSITSPANGATYAEPARVTINATANDSDGAVARVDFYVGTQFLGSVTASPYSFTWSNVPAGTYSLTALARDDDDATTTSAAVSLTVSAAPPPPTPTSVAFTASPDHDTLVTSYTVAIYRATDPVSGTPVATKDLGKPTPANGEITVEISDIVNPLAAGSYYAVVTAVGSAGAATSAPSANFTK